MLDLAIIIVALPALLSLALLILGLVRPGVTARIIPWSGRLAPSRRRVALSLAPVVAALLVAEGVLLAVPNMSVSLADGNRVVAGESHGLAIAVANTGLISGRCEAGCTLDGKEQAAVVARVPGRRTANLSVPLPGNLAPGSHTVVIGGTTCKIVALKPATFSVSALSSDGEMVKTGQKVALHASVTNAGEVAGKFGGELTVNGHHYAAKPVSMGPGENKILQFVFTSRRQGTCRCRVGDASCNVVVVKPLRFANGHFLVRTASGGSGIAKVKNTNKVDGVVVLTRSSDRKVAVIACYVCARHSFEITGITDGTYYFYYTLGRDWNTYTDGFMTTVQRTVYTHVCAFSTSSWTTSWTDASYRYTQRHVRYSGWRVTLYEVSAGDPNYKNVTRNNFPRVD